jgi:mRNA interferase MazF
VAEGRSASKASLIKPVLTTIEKRLILRKLGELQEPDLTALRQALTAILG